MQIKVKLITVKSETYELTVDNEMSVREFKDEIASKTSIDPAHQRIIFGGNVLLDEFKLKSYDLDGKTMHVIEQQHSAGNMRQIQQRMNDHLRRTVDNLLRQQYEARYRNVRDRQDCILRQERMIALRQEAAAVAASSTSTDSSTDTSTAKSDKTEKSEDES